MGKPSLVTQAPLTETLTAVESEHPCQSAEPKICIKKDDTSLIQPAASIYNSTHHHPSFDSPSY